MKIFGCTKFSLLITIYKSQWVEAGVSKPLEESEQKEVDKIGDEGGDDQSDNACDEADEVTEDDGGHPATDVGEPSKEDHSWDGSDVEEWLGQGGDPCPVTHPVLLHGQGHVVLLGDVLPPLLAGDHLPGGVSNCRAVSS